MTRAPIAGAALLCLPWVIGCAGAPPTDSDDLDPGTPRIVVMAPAAAEMLRALGLIDHVVGIGEFGPWPAAIAELPQAGGYASPNVEQVLALRADTLVTTASEAAVAGHRRLEAVGVEVLALDTSTYEGIFGALSDLGAAFDRQDAAQRIERGMREEIRALEGRAAELPRRRVLFVVGRDPLYVAGPGSHVDRMITGVGGRNVMGDVLGAYQQVSVEAVLERMPEVIIDTSDNRPGALRGREPGNWNRWRFLPAVQQDRVYWIDPSQLVIPGLRLPEMTQLMAQLIHPETFGEAPRERYGAVDFSEPGGMEGDATQ